MKKDAIIGLLRYGGVSKSDFNMVKPDIAKENHRVWKFSALVLEVIFLIALIIAATVPDLKSYIVGYIILVPYFLFVEDINSHPRNILGNKQIINKVYRHAYEKDCQ